MGIGSIISEAIASAPQQNRVDGDYEKDCLLYCGRCHTPKQFKGRIESLNLDIDVPCLCECENEGRIAYEEECRKRRESAHKKRARLNGFPYSMYATWTFDKDDGRCPEQSELCKSYAEKFERGTEIGLLLCGDTGNGKSFMSACIANELIDRGFSVLMTNMSYITNAINATFERKQAELDVILGYDLLIIDDLGTERDTAFMMEHVFNVIDGRYKLGKPMIISTNLSVEEMQKADGIVNQRIYQRVLEKCYPIEFKGMNRRAINSAQMQMGAGKWLAEG